MIPETSQKFFLLLLIILVGQFAGNQAVVAQQKEDNLSENTILVAQNEVAAKNTSSYAGRGRWNWTIFVEARHEILNDIHCVEYTLHPTFPDPVKLICDRGEDREKGFFYSANGWGTFRIGVKILFRDGREEYLHHQLILE